MGTLAELATRWRNDADDFACGSECAAASDVRDEGMAPRNRLTGAGCKPPYAAQVKSLGCERYGKGANRHQVGINEGEQP